MHIYLEVFAAAFVAVPWSSPQEQAEQAGLQSALKDVMALFS